MTANPTAIHVAALAERNGWRPEQIGTSVRGVPIEAWWPTGEPSRVMWAAIHGEESVTMQLAWQLLRTVHADDSCAVVVPVLNPDGVLLATRQNANGVDLNRNFPTESWVPDSSPTFWPTATIRTPPHRTQFSSPGSSPGSEPETQAIMDLVTRVQPAFVIDLHTPLECVIAISERSIPMAEHLAEPGGLTIVRGLENPTPGDSAAWCETHGAIAVTYEFELDTLPRLWKRHRDALVRCVVDQFQ
jgi:protein MpaA